jgi:hypothetical protein
MGSLFSKPKTVKPPPVPIPEPPPEIISEEAEEKVRRRRGRGRAATIITGSLEPENVRKKTLLG